MKRNTNEMGIQIQEDCLNLCAIFWCYFANLAHDFLSFRFIRLLGSFGVTQPNVHTKHYHYFNTSAIRRRKATSKYRLHRHQFLFLGCIFLELFRLVGLLLCYAASEIQNVKSANYSHIFVVFLRHLHLCIHGYKFFVFDDV
jgi:hypothetical protein